MLLSFAGFNVWHFCFECFPPLLSASDDSPVMHVMR